MEVESIKTLPLLERPREKAIYYGIDKLSNIELLALIIGSGGKNNNALLVATTLLKKANGINNLLSLTYKEYASIPGIKQATALRFLAIKEIVKRKANNQEEHIYFSIKEIANKYRYIIGNNEQEKLYLILLNYQKKIIQERELYIGTASNLTSNIDQIINVVKKENVKYFLLVHNHPSNNVSPSKYDIISTNNLNIVSKENNLVLLDHIIVGKDETYFSFKENETLID